MEKSDMVIYEIDPTKRYIVSCPGSMANAVRVHQRLAEWLVSNNPFVIITDNVVLKRLQEIEEARVLEKPKYRPIVPGELLIDNSIVTSIADLDAAIKYLIDFKESLRIPDTCDCCCEEECTEPPEYITRSEVLEIFQDFADQLQKG